MTLEIKLAYYRKSDWDKLMNSIVDRYAMHDTWEAWNEDYQRTKKLLKNQGFTVYDMVIDIDHLNAHCMDRGLNNDGKTRSQYTSQLHLTKKKK